MLYGDFVFVGLKFSVCTYWEVAKTTQIRLKHWTLQPDNHVLPLFD